MTIRNRLFVTYLGLTTLAVIVTGGYLLWSFQEHFLGHLRADMAGRADAVADGVHERLVRGDRAGIDTVVRRYGAQEGIYLRIIGSDGRLVASAQPDIDQRLPDWRDAPAVAQAFATGSARARAHSLLGQDARLYEARRLDHDGQIFGVLHMSRTLTPFETMVQSTQLSVAGALAAVFALCVVVSVWLARSLATPVQAMRNFAVQVGRGELTTRLALGDRSDELGELAVELNRMSARLAVLDDERRAFLASVSHELRTPVSNVSVTLEALAGGADAEPALRSRFIRTALDETGRLARLVHDLLDLGRLEAGLAPLEPELMPAGALVERCARAIEGRAAARGIRLVVASEEVVVRVDRERMLQALMNIVDNAVKFSPEGGEIRLGARARGADAVIEVRDQGPGIAADRLPRVFEQFYSGEREGPRRGLGLGLTIARRIIDAHGGSIVAGNTAEGGALLTVTLPRGS